MRTRMMALFALIAFCAMPIEAKKVKILSRKKSPSETIQR